MRYSFGNFYNEIYKRDDEYYNRDYKSVFEYEPYLYEFPILGTLLKKLSKIDYFIFGLKLEGINMGGRRSLNDIIPKYFKFSSRKVDDSLRILLKNNLIEISLVDKPGDQRFVGISADNYITFIKKFVNQESLFQQKLIDDTKQKNMRFSKKKN